MSDFASFIYPNGAPCIINKKRVKALREAPGGHTIIVYQKGREFEVVRDIESVRAEIGGFEK